MKKLLLPIFIFVITLTCTKEKSCEDGCGGVAIVSPVDTIDTPKNYFVSYDIYVPNNNEISHIEVQIKRKPEPYFWTFEIMNHIDDSLSCRYVETYDVTWLLENNSKGDTAFFRYATIMPDRTFIYSGTIDTLIK